MSSRKLLVASLVFTIILTASISTRTANAQASAPTCTNTDYLAPVLVLNHALSALDYTKPDTIGNGLASLIMLRNQYEDIAAPEGCESIRSTLIQFLTLREDVIFAQMAAKADAANVADYKDIVTAGAARFEAAGKVLNDTVTPLKFPDTMPSALATPEAGATPAAPEACSDPAFIAELAPAQAAISTLKGINIAPVIKLRNQFEDMEAPAGCGDAKNLLVQLITSIEDQVTLAVVSQADAANAAAYTKFLGENVTPRLVNVQKAFLAAVSGAMGPTPTP